VGKFQHKKKGKCMTTGTSDNSRILVAFRHGTDADILHLPVSGDQKMNSHSRNYVNFRFRNKNFQL
jgi:hypothetical protein